MGGIKVNVLTLSDVDHRGFEPCRVKRKTIKYKISMYCFAAKHTVF